MSIVIIGGNERMENQYKEICKQYSCKVKVFTKKVTNLKNQIGRPDLLILFTSTVSHKMVRCAVVESERGNIAVERCHSSSASALKNILNEYCLDKKCPHQDCVNCINK